MRPRNVCLSTSNVFIQPTLQNIEAWITSAQAWVTNEPAAKRLTYVFIPPIALGYL